MIHLKAVIQRMKRKSSLSNNFHHHINHYIRSESIVWSLHSYAVGELSPSAYPLKTVCRLAKPKHVTRNLIGRKNISHAKRSHNIIRISLPMATLITGTRLDEKQYTGKRDKHTCGQPQTASRRRYVKRYISV